MNYIDYESFLSEIYTPLKGIETITDVIYHYYNEEWNFLATNREQAEELLSLIFAIKNNARYLLLCREESANRIYDKQFNR